jgi:Leucine-rich repeat (LRR) protein
MTNDIDSPPTQIDISSVTYDLTEMVVTWEQSSDNDFVSYELLYSETQSGEQTSIITITDINTTSYTITEFDPSQGRWYWIKVTDYWSLTIMSNGYMVLDSPPTPPELNPITYNDGFEISWSQNNDDDFVSYKLYESLSEDMSNDTLIYETDDRTDTTYFKTIQNFRYYQITSEDVWGLQSTSNIEVGDYDVELWGEVYSIENTTELNLRNSSLSGSIPPEIGNLTNLTYLDLHGNQLIGEIPPEIGNLTNLVVMYLSNGWPLSGEIPPEIGNLTNLERLYLYDNQFTGEIPSEIGNLTNLTILRLYGNQLTGSIPPEIGNLTYLEELWLGINELTGSIPPEIGNLTNLTYLHLSYNELTGSILSDIGNLTNLEYLNLSNNQLTGSIPSEIGNLSNLTKLYLSSNQLTGSIPSEIGNLTNLELLSLSNNQLTGVIPESICDLDNIWSASHPYNLIRVYENQLCPPYPSCIEDYVGYQDTSDCP